MEITREELEDLVKHMFNAGANILTAAETALPQVDNAQYSKGTKKDIKVHLSHDILLSLGLIYPAIDYMKQHMPEHAAVLDRWKKFHEEINATA